MSNKSDICHICLRTDRTLKIIDVKLSGFHAVLGDTVVVNSKYCYECEYLLRKSYKFKIKCMRAMKILNDWNHSEGVQPASHLHTLLPESLNFWTSDTTQIYSFVDVEDNTDKYNVPESEIVEARQSYEYNSLEDIVSFNLLDSLPKDIKIENNDIQNILTDTDTNKCLKYLTIKNEDSNAFEEIIVQNNGNLEKDDKTHLDKETEDMVNDTSFDLSDDDDDDNKLIYLKNKLCKSKEERKKCKRKRSTDEDWQFKDEYSNDSKRSVKKEKGSQRGVKKKKDNGQIEKKIDKDKKTRFHNQNFKSIIEELVNTESKTKTENDHKLKLCKKRPFTKERLKEEIKSRFASCGEVRAADGTVIDKAFIMQCLEDKVTEFVMKQLYQAVYRKPCFKPKALKLFKCIQNRYKTEYDAVFDIEYLNTKEKMVEEFEKRKSYESYLTAEFKCEICYQGFKHEKKLQYHRKCHEESAGEMVCSICKVRHRSMKSLINHMNAHEAVYRCKLCPLVTYYKNSMRNHYQQHKGVKYTCKECNTIFGSMSAFRTHVSYRHARSHACTRCGRAYSTRVGLRAHLTREHRNESPVAEGATSVKCVECPLSFASSDACQRHVLVTHRQVLRGRPPGAGAGAMRSETRPRKRPVITCRVCGASGASWGWLSLHVATEHPGEDLAQLYADKHTHLCDVCGKSFSTIYTLQAHLNVHTGSRPFSCESCSARFHRAMSLRLHRLVHTPPSKPCQTCGKKFRSTSNLYNHMRSHIGDRRYKCEICGKGFIHRCSLNEHVRGVHKNIRRVRKRGVTDAADNH